MRQGISSHDSGFESQPVDVSLPKEESKKESSEEDDYTSVSNNNENWEKWWIWIWMELTKLKDY